jgi:protein gp37
LPTSRRITELRAAGERRRVFCLSLGDVFEDRPELVEPRKRLFATIERTHSLDWLLLTKRPQNIRPLVEQLESVYYPDMALWDTFPLPNVWLGVSVEDQERAIRRIRALLEIPAAVRFLSVEPLLEDLGDLTGYLTGRDPATGSCMVCGHPVRCRCEPGFPSVDWVIIGGESGSNARPCDLAWIRSIVAQCRQADVPAFVKQLGSNPVADGRRVVLRDKKGGDPDERPEDLRVRELPAEGDRR